jgi:hypothetical protein
MIWVAWRQFRTQALVALGLLIAFSVLVLVTGLHLRDVYSSLGGARCGTHNDCTALVGHDAQLAGLLGPALLAIPSLLGMFWGAPLVARELESGTYRLAWTQSVTRRRWLTGRVALVGVAALAVAGLASWLVSWWFAPLDAVKLNRFDPSVFTERGTVAIGYAGFAFALGVAAGALTRRTLPAMAATLLGFAGARVAFTFWVRPHLLGATKVLAPVTFGNGVGFVSSAHGVSIAANASTIPNAWMISAALVDRAHHAVSAAQLHDLLVRACPTIAAGLPQPTGSPPKGPAGPAGGAVLACEERLSHHLQQLVTYQAPGHYWPLQALETGIFLAGALALIGATVWRVGRRAPRRPAASEPAPYSPALEVAPSIGVPPARPPEEGEKSTRLHVAIRARIGGSLDYSHSRSRPTGVDHDPAPRPPIKWRNAMHMNAIAWHRPRAGRPSRRPQRWWLWLAAGPLTVCLTAACASAAASAAAAPLNCAPPGVKMPPCYSPRAYQVAYGVAPLLSRGIDGRGETVAMPELASSTPSMDIRHDLAAFDHQFGLPPAKLHVVNTIARSATPYLADEEEVEDAEMVHAIAPGATLDVILVPSNTTSSSASFAAAATKVLQASVALHVAVISISASEGEHYFTNAEVADMNAALKQTSDHHVTVVASSGDLGAISDSGPPVQVSLPASDPLVLGVGGTILDATNPGSTYLGEMAWNDGTDASNGGYSNLFPRPSYQEGIARIGATRGVPDVAANAESATAMALEYGNGELRPATGTSASTPLWAGVIALADQQAGHPLGFVNPAIYAIARGPASHRAFHDVVTGDNSVLWSTGVFTGYNAGPGWDPVTGWGSPDAQYLVPLLAGTAPRSGRLTKPRELS